MNLINLQPLEKLSNNLQSNYKKGLDFYQRYQKFLPIVAFFGGFTWDSITMTRIDRLSDNIILFIYLMLAGGGIILLQFSQNNMLKKNWLIKYQDWYPLALQFFLGGLFSGYVVFYFQSAALTKNWLFLGLLIILLVSNEFLEKRMNNLYLISALYFLAAFSFFIFFIPVVFKKMNVYTFFIGAFLGLIIALGCLYILYRKIDSVTRNKFIKISLPAVILFFFLIFSYYKNWIPPVPLSLKYGAIYHHVEKQGAEYQLKFEKPRWYQFLKKSDKTYQYAKGDTVFCFASIFAPTKLTKKCYHQWQKYFPNRGEWITTDSLGYKITGGRDGGYRGYTYKRNVSPGDWRIDVKIDEGATLGRINFEIIEIENTSRKFKTVYK